MTVRGGWKDDEAENFCPNRAKAGRLVYSWMLELEFRIEVPVPDGSSGLYSQPDCGHFCSRVDRGVVRCRERLGRERLRARCGG